MLLFHGSPFEFTVPSLSMSRGFCDFGRGLYLASNETDSLGCCLKGGSRRGFLYVYEADEDRIMSLPEVVAFENPDDDWLRMVYECRMFGAPTGGHPSCVVGPTAGHEVSRLFRRYRITRPPFDACVGELRRKIVTERFGTQWCLRTEEAISILDLVDVETICMDEDSWKDI